MRALIKKTLLGLGICLATLPWAAAQAPRIAQTIPPLGATNVDPGLSVLSVTFDQDMGQGMSWCGGGDAFPETTGQGQWVNPRTCVLPVRLQPNHTYHLGINCPSFQNFRSATGVSAVPTEFTFTTGEGSAPAQTSASTPAPTGPPMIVETNPVMGVRDVDPSLSEITVTFDQDMAGGFSWTGGGPLYPEIAASPHWRDARTAVLPVSLEASRFYRVGINSRSHQNFRSQAGQPTPPRAIWFCTEGAPEEELAYLAPPTVVNMTPANGATGVDPNLSEITITFNQPMGGGRSLTGGGPSFPPFKEGSEITWSEDMRTLIWPVSLEPNHDYAFGINSFSHINFMSDHGVPAPPRRVTFTTGPGQ